MIFLVFGITQPGIEPWSPGPLLNNLIIINVKINYYQNSVSDCDQSGTKISTIYISKDIENFKEFLYNFDLILYSSSYHVISVIAEV